MNGGGSLHYFPVNFRRGAIWIGKAQIFLGNVEAFAATAYEEEL